MGKRANERRLAENEAMAMTRRLRIGAPKPHLVAESNRGLAVDGALRDAHV